MNILILGAGGREHALGWKLKQSRQVGKLFFAPGNGGTASLGENVKLDIETVNTKLADAINYFCAQNKVEMIVIGPEDPLAQGLADRLAKPGRVVFGPVAAAARLEADKAWAKQLMRAASIPTAEARTFTNAESAIDYVQNHETPVVVKATGLAKGKGVVVCSNANEAEAAVHDMMVKRIHGDAGATVVIEERISGQEVSILALVDGRNIYMLDTAQDHKQVGEGDKGPNTGGMGAYTPTPLVDDALLRVIERQVMVPIVDAMRREDIEFRGVLYAGLMLTAGGPKVLEFNCRFGDPECQPLLMRMKGDLAAILRHTAEGTLDKASIDWDPRPCCCVVLASGGYPGDYEKGHPITGIEAAESDPDVKVFVAGAVRKGDDLVNSGGRVLNVCAMGDTLAEARDKANAACEKIHFKGVFHRRDIGSRVLKG